MDIFHSLAAKSLMTLFNLLILICGFVALILGAVDKSDIGPVNFLVPEDYSSILYLTIITIIIGILCIFSSIFGCLSTLMEKSYLIVAFAITLCFLILAQIAVSTTFLVMIDDRNLLETKSEHAINLIFNRYDNDSTGAAKKKSDFIQQELRCCGIQKDKPWGEKYPSSCVNPYTSINFSELCQKQFTDKLVRSTKRLSHLLLALTAIEIVALFSAVYMARVVNDEEE